MCICSTAACCASVASAKFVALCTLTQYWRSTHLRPVPSYCALWRARHVARKPLAARPVIPSPRPPSRRKHFNKFGWRADKYFLGRGRPICCALARRPTFCGFSARDGVPGWDGAADNRRNYYHRSINDTDATRRINGIRRAQHGRFIMARARHAHTCTCERSPTRRG